MHQQSLILLYPRVKEKMHLQENTLFDLEPKKIQYLTFDLDLGVKVTRNVAQYPLHHVTYSNIKFEFATSNGLGGDTFTRNVTDGHTDVQTDDRPTLV